MAFLDRIRTLVGTPSEGAAAFLRGPLRLAAGDGVGYYKERFVVLGVRRVEGDGQVVWQYCLADRAGERAVLAVEEGTEPTLWMQRPVDAEIDWGRDVLEGIADEPFKLSCHGTAAVRQTGDTGVPTTSSMKFREYEDASADRTVVLEDWSGHREVRVGEMVHEAEMTFVRAAEARGEVDPFASAAESVGGRGTPDAASRALSDSYVDEDAAFSPAESHEDLDPTAFDDEEWGDEENAEPLEPSGPIVEAVLDSEDDEWNAAAKYLRDHGIPAETKR